MEIDPWLFGGASQMIRRGEFKTPGGKLIAVEFDDRDQQLHDVVVTGDFFLYPEEALPTLSGALEGALTTLTHAQYATRVQLALENLQLLGSSPEGLATAVCRALADDGSGGSASAS